MGTMSFCSLTPSQISMSKFISNKHHLTLLENHCTNIQDLKKIHAHLIKTGLSKHPIAISRVLAFSATSNAADISYAHSIFARIDDPNLFMWNTITRGFSQSSEPLTAILLFIDMLTNSDMDPSRLTYPSLFKAYAQLGLPHCGAQLHGRVVKLGLECDSFIRNTIIHMYANGGFLSEACRIFDEGRNSDVVGWNSMIMGLAKSREIDEARRLFEKMGCMRNAISWNSMISGCVRNDEFTEAVNLFRRMQDELGIIESEFTMVSLLNACAALGSLEQGEWMHQYICEKGFVLNVIVITAIVDMYCKCGAIDKARQVFDTSPSKGLSTWNSMILGLANNGCEDDAIQLFSELVSSQVVEPDDVTFLGILTACTYIGDVGKARDYFLLMTDTYKIEPSVKHYNCMVSVLGQAGLVSEAEQLIREMPIAPDSIIWGSLLSACTKHGDVDMAIWAAKNVNEIDPTDSAAYILMSNVYASSGKFHNAISQRVCMKEIQVVKEKGGSCIEINGHVQEFASSEVLRPQMYDMTSLIHSDYEDEEFVSEAL